MVIASYCILLQRALRHRTYVYHDYILLYSRYSSQQNFAIIETMRILSWNVNGIRAVYKKGFIDWLLSDKPDIFCLQEIKASEEQIPDAMKAIQRYHTYFSSAERKGYSGVALYTKQKPKNLTMKFGIKKFDSEGRAIIAEYEKFILFNIYFPNGKASKERLRYKMEFYNVFLRTVDRLKKEGKKLIICGDVNTAHREIDLARPKENSKISGFLPEERAWIDTFISHGFIDTFRVFHTDGGQYTWWDQKSRARERNVGWRIDYFFISDNLKRRLRSAFIMPEVIGSDHCPVGIEIVP
jgi:exodeoxyribonuclease-3